MKRILLILSICGIALSNAQTLHSIKPSDTDPNIDVAANNHYVYISTTATKLNKLLVFFPGTGGAPAGYTLFLKEAANLGYHVIGLDYPNPVTINSVCGSSTDTMCFTNARLEVFDGIDRNATIQVNTANSIKNRLQKVLKYLVTNYASEGWDQYYKSDTIINWSQIALAGHSQGGGHAGIISKYYGVERVIMFGATDWMNPYNKPASWISQSGLTLKSQYYGFTHANDELVTFTTLEIPTWTAYGMYAYGSNVNIDTCIALFYNSHTLTSYAAPATSGSSAYHGACVVSMYTPKNGSGNPVYTLVWDYLLTHQTPTGVTNNSKQRLDISIYPNPASNSLNIEIASNALVNIINSLGQTVIAKTFVQGEKAIDISQLPKGLYHLFIHNSETNYARSFIKE